MSRELQERISNLRSIGGRVTPDDAWVKKTRETLLMQVRNSLPVEKTSSFSQIRLFVNHFVPAGVTHFFRGPLVATLSILAIIFGGSAASVSAAEQSLPGDFLYNLKLATEQARLALTSAKDEKLKLKLEFTSRRGDELKNVAKQTGSKKQDRVVKAAEILKRDLKTVKEQLEDVNKGSTSEKVVEVARLVDQKTNEIVQTLQMTKAEIPVETKEKITEAQAAAADTGVKAIEVLIEKNTESVGNLHEGELAEAMQKHTQTIVDATVEGSLTVSSTAQMRTITSVVSSSTLPYSETMEQIKSATLEAFAAQKNAEQIQVIAASSSTSSTTSPLSNSESSSTGFEYETSTSSTPTDITKTSTTTNITSP